MAPQTKHTLGNFSRFLGDNFRRHRTFKMRKLHICLFLLLVLVPIIASQKPRRNKKASNRLQDMEKKLQALLNRSPKVSREKAQKKSLRQNIPDIFEDPCTTMHCTAGRECVIDKQGKASCQCISECPDMDDERRMVCSNYNTTWPSDCKLHQVRCWCAEKHEDCPEKKYEHMHIDYYGRCQEVTKCEEFEMADFPRRMREWLFNIMTEMTDAGSLSDTFAEEDESTKWVNAAVLKWCMLNDHPKDRFVSRHELFPLRAPLHTMEDCISPFLDNCDQDDNHEITLKEWISCLELKEDHVDKIEDLCDEIRPQN